MKQVSHYTLLNLSERRENQYTEIFESFSDLQDVVEAELLMTENIVCYIYFIDGTCERINF